MILHSGAGLHGHEYSTVRPSTASPHLPPRGLLRSALRSRADVDPRTPSSSPSPSAPPQTPRPSPLPRRLSQPHSPSDNLKRVTARSSRPRPVSESFSAKREVSVRFVDPPTVTAAAKLDTDKVKGMTVAVAVAAAVGTVDLPSSSYLTAVVASEDEEASVNFSDYSDSAAESYRKRRKRRTPRKSTTYVLAQPAPRNRIKSSRRFIQIRPRLLLQLQVVTPPRPKPTLDVIPLPSNIVSGHLIMPKLVRRFPRLFRTKPQLCLDDVILARSEDYDSPPGHCDDGGSASEDLDKRDLVAVISPLAGGGLSGSDTVEIVLEDGTVWTGSALANGCFEFETIREDGAQVKARWVKKLTSSLLPGTAALPGTTVVAPSLSSSLLSHHQHQQTPAAPNAGYKYTFSVLDPSSRRHPIMANLTATTLEIMDHYTTVSSSSGRYPPTRPMSIDSTGGGFLSPTSNAAQQHQQQQQPLLSSSSLLTPVPVDASTPPAERTTRLVDADTRAIITASATWLSLRNTAASLTAQQQQQQQQQRQQQISSRPQSASRICQSPPKRRASVHSGLPASTALASAALTQCQDGAASRPAPTDGLDLLSATTADRSGVGDFPDPAPTAVSRSASSRRSRSPGEHVAGGAWGEKLGSDGLVSPPSLPRALSTRTVFTRQRRTDFRNGEMDASPASRGLTADEDDDNDDNDDNDKNMVDQGVEPPPPSGRRTPFRDRIRGWKDRLTLRVKGR